jgi:hypothetical protein
MRRAGWNTLYNAAPPMTASSTILANILYDQLVHYLGPHTTRSAIKTFSNKAVGKAPNALTVEDMPKVLNALRPMMRTLIGVEECEAVIAQLSEELGL